ncbi:hypothetical protein [Amycolatopsis sp. NPDC059021]|uniref:hypothetical protein n=1 Tax=Amycolatopsis sp. NPDC059021 TaxID=3346704 RepID=UPI0036705A64
MSIAAALGIMSGTAQGAASKPSSEVSVQVAYKCYVNSYWLCAETLDRVYQRAQPTKNSDYVVLLDKGRSVQLRCWKEGEVINGNNVWYYTATDVDYPYQTIGYVSAAYLSTGKDPEWGIGHC